MPLSRLGLAARSGVLALALMAATAGPLLAQTPTPAPAAAPSLPAAIHQGTCQQPVTQPAFDASGVTLFKKGDQPVTQQDVQGRLTLSPLLSTGETTIQTKLDDLLDPATPYVLAVHASAQDFATIVACGEIAGPVLDDQLVIALRPIANSGYAGVAFLTRDGDTTKTNVYLMGDVGALSGQAATPVAATTPTPVAGAPVVQPTATVASTATLAPTPTAGTTPSATATATATTTATATATSTATVTVTATPTPTPGG
jgi:hypothetical protein